MTWILIDDKVPEIKAEPWSLYWKEWKSESAEFRNFLLDPLSVLARDLKGVTKEYKVTSEILNHQVGFLGTAVCNTAMVMPEERRIKLTFYKHE